MVVVVVAAVTVGGGCCGYDCGLWEVEEMILRIKNNNKNTILIKW